MKAHPDLVRAIVLNCLVSTPEHAKRQLLSRDLTRRVRAEDALTARIVLALGQIV